MTESLLERDHIIFQEMMCHPALFMHSNPVNVAILGDHSHGILQEILKHADIMNIAYFAATPFPDKDARIKVYANDPSQWFSHAEPESFDIIVAAQHSPAEQFSFYARVLKKDGILVQIGDSYFNLAALKSLRENIAKAGFADIHLINFPQPSFASGWRTAVMAKKTGNFLKIREKDIYNKNFITRYYNFDVHKASLVLPEFVRESIEL